jgi:hypothetical protein
MSSYEYSPRDNFNGQPFSFICHDVLPHRSVDIKMPQADLQTVYELTGIRNHVLLATVQLESRRHIAPKRDNRKVEPYSEMQEFFVFRSMQRSPDLIHSGRLARSKKPPRQYAAGQMSVIDGTSLIKLQDINKPDTDVTIYSRLIDQAVYSPFIRPEEVDISDIHEASVPFDPIGQSITISHDTVGGPWDFHTPEYSAFETYAAQFRIEYIPDISLESSSDFDIPDYPLTRITNQSGFGNLIQVVERT